MLYLALTAGVIALVELAIRVDISGTVRLIIQSSSESATVISSKTLNDDLKQKKVQSLSLKILKHSLSLLASLALLIAGFLFFYYLLGLLLGINLNILTESLYSIQTQIILMIIAFIYATVRPKIVR